MWEGLWEYKSDFFERHSIETVSHTQDSLIDKLFNKGDVTVSLDMANSFEFKNVTNPGKVVDIIRNFIQTYSKVGGMKNGHDDLDTHDDKYNILLEALTEVVQEYSEKKKSGDENEF